MKIFNLSPHRSGTKSFTDFIGKYGFNTSHWLGDQFDALMEHAKTTYDVWCVAKLVIPSYDTFSDLPWPILTKHLIKYYPHENFILIIREPQAWVNSIRRHTKGRSLSWLETQFYNHLTGQPLRTLDDISDEKLIQYYQKFLQQTQKFVPDLGLFELSDPKLNEKLAKYLHLKDLYPFAHIKD